MQGSGANLLLFGLKQVWLTERCPKHMCYGIKEFVCMCACVCVSIMTLDNSLLYSKGLPFNGLPELRVLRTLIP